MYKYLAIKDCFVKCGIHSSIKEKISAISATLHEINGYTRFNVLKDNVASVWLKKGDYIDSLYPLEIDVESEGTDAAIVATFSEDTEQVQKKSTTGIKYDHGKRAIAECIVDFQEPLLEVCKVWEFGKGKYGKSNWKQVEGGYDRYSNALLRHMLKEETEVTDPETGILHASHVAWNALARLQFLLDRAKENEDERNCNEVRRTDN